MDRLERGIILEVIGWDHVFRHVYAQVERFFLLLMISQLGQSDYYSLWQEENMGKPKSAHKTTHTDNLVKAVRAMGISFQIWTKKRQQRKGLDFSDGK